MDVIQAENILTLLKAGSFVDYEDLTSAIKYLFNNDFIDAIEDIVQSEEFDVSTNHPYFKDEYGDDDSFQKLLNVIYNMSAYNYIKKMILENDDSSRFLAKSVASDKQENLEHRLIAIESLLKWEHNCQYEINQVIDSLDENDDPSLINTIINLSKNNIISTKAKAKQEQFKKIKEQSKEIKMIDHSKLSDEELIALIKDNKISKEDVISICFDYDHFKRGSKAYMSCVDFLVKNNLLAELAEKIFIKKDITRLYSDNEIKDYFLRECIKYNVETRKLASTSFNLSKENLELITSEYCNLDVINNLSSKPGLYSGYLCSFAKRTDNKHFLSAMFNNGVSDVRIAVAGSKFAPANDLKKFIKETSAFDLEEGNCVGLGLAIASNQDIPADVLETFYAEGKDVGKIFHALANNPNYKYCIEKLQVTQFNEKAKEFSNYIKSRKDIFTEEQIDLLFSNKNLYIYMELIDCKNVNENTIARLINDGTIGAIELIEKLSKKDSHVIRMALINTKFKNNYEAKLVKNILEFNNQEEIEKLKELSKDYEFIKMALIEKGILQLDKFEQIKNKTNEQIITWIKEDYEKKQISSKELDFILDYRKNPEFDNCKIINAISKHPNVNSETLIKNINDRYGNNDLFHNLVTHKDVKVAFAAINKFALGISDFIKAFESDVISDEVFIALVNHKNFPSYLKNYTEVQKAFINSLNTNVKKHQHDYTKFDFKDNEIYKFIVANCNDHHYLWKRYRAVDYAKEFLSNPNLTEDAFHFIKNASNNGYYKFSYEVKTMIKNHKFNKEDLFSNPVAFIKKIEEGEFVFTEQDFEKIFASEKLCENEQVMRAMFLYDGCSYKMKEIILKEKLSKFKNYKEILKDIKNNQKLSATCYFLVNEELSKFIDFSDPDIDIQRVRNIVDRTEKYDLTYDDYKNIYNNIYIKNSKADDDYILASLYVYHKDNVSDIFDFCLEDLKTKNLNFLQVVKTLLVKKGERVPVEIEEQIKTLKIFEEQQRKKNRSIKQRSIEDFNEAIYLGAAIKTQNVISSMFNSNDKTINNVLKSDGFKAVASFILGTIIAELNPENNHIKTYADKCRELAIATVGVSAFDTIISTVFKDKQNIRIAIPNEVKQVNSINLTDEELFIEQMVSNQKNGMVN